MKALSIWPHYAALIACGAKTIEGRSWQTSYRGPLAIHSTKTWGPGGFGEVQRWLAEDADSAMIEALAAAHAPAAPPMLEVFAPEDDARDLLPASVRRFMRRNQRDDIVAHADAFPRSCIVAVADVVDCVPVDDLPGAVYDEQAPFCGFDALDAALVLDNVRRLPDPVPCTGRQGRPWDLPSDVGGAVVAQLAAA